MKFTKSQLQEVADVVNNRIYMEAPCSDISAHVEAGEIVFKRHLTDVAATGISYFQAKDELALDDVDLSEVLEQAYMSLKSPVFA